MHHYRVVLDSEIPETDVLDENGTATGDTRQMTMGELQQVDMFHICDLPSGESVMLEDGRDYTLSEKGYVFLCAASTRNKWGKFPGDKVLTSGFLNDRNQRLPKNVRDRAWQAVVYRAKDGRVNLRSKIINDLGLNTGVGAKVPADGSYSAEPENPSEAESALEEARKRASPQDGSEPTVDRKRVAMKDVEDSDVVESDEIYPLRISGERGGR